MGIENRYLPGNGYSHAITVTGTLAFVSGQVAMDESGNLVGADDLAAQTAQCLSNLHSVLVTLGADWTNVVKFGWFVTDASQVQTVRDVRDKFLGDAPKPASTLIEVAGLFRPEFLVEVDAIVALP